MFYMGLAGLSDICKKLIVHGKQPETPVAVISKGTTPEQIVVTGTLTTVAEKVLAAALVSPTLIIVGQVVSAPSRLREVG